MEKKERKKSKDNTTKKKIKEFKNIKVPTAENEKTTNLIAEDERRWATSKDEKKLKTNKARKYRKRGNRK